MEEESRDQDETLRPVNKIAGLARVAVDRGVRGERTPSHPARRASPAEPSGKEGGCRKNGGEVM